jgi:hypothetical protein
VSVHLRIDTTVIIFYGKYKGVTVSCRQCLLIHKDMMNCSIEDLECLRYGQSSQQMYGRSNVNFNATLWEYVVKNSKILQSDLFLTCLLIKR